MVKEIKTYWDEEENVLKEYYFLKDERFYGLRKKWYSNSQLENEHNYKDNKFHGLCKSWYENGQLRSKDNYKNNKLHGLSRTWYIRGVLSSESYYFNDKSCTRDEFKEWDENLWVQSRSW